MNFLKTLFVSAFAGVFGLFSMLYAAPRPSAEDLTICYEKNKVSQFDYHGHIAVSLTGNLAAVIAEEDKSLAPVDYIKHDPYLGLYLVKMPTTLIAPFMMDEKDLKTDTWVNVLENNTTQIGHVKSLAGNLGEFDELSFEPEKKGLLLCDCCQMVGIATGGNKFIGSRYLRHFIKHEDVYYGDIGAVFDNLDGTLVVKSVYPFGPSNDKLMVADIVKAVNEVVPRDLRHLNEMILFAQKGESLRIEVERKGKKQIFNIKVPGKNEQYFENNATQLDLAQLDLNKINFEQNATKIDENKTAPKVETEKKPKPKKARRMDNLYTGYGFSVDRMMRVSRVSPNSKAAKAGLEVGDLVMQVGKEPVQNASQLERKLSNYRLNHLLVERKNFQFFIRIRK